VFVCGLHRSGTSVLGRNIARFDDCTGFKNTGVTEDEGQFLQDIYPVAFKYGGPGRFGFDPRAHRTETSPLLTPQNVTRLRESWHRYWDKSKRIHVEKTPSNILMTRFLQAAFPNSYFVVIRRHPIAVSLASQKMWKINLSPLHRLLEHWLHCHELFEDDKQYLRRVYELTYEAYVKDPARYHEEIAAFIGTRLSRPSQDDTLRSVVQVGSQIPVRMSEDALDEISGAHNEKYLQRWSKLLLHSPFKGYYRYLAGKYEPSFRPYNYSLIENLEADEKAISKSGQPSAMIGNFYCLGADACTFIYRLLVRVKEQVSKVGQTCLRESVSPKFRSRTTVSKGGANLFSS
jgi:Sulfotransferase family